ncbi:TraR/DksA C4-type zinc finger protein [Proteiniborus sp.]|uniref:TraR/DksA C4-type zinc finger protein n=1 Tax=Proteiniborus sp. TaxID=2079015 RepID=UPI0033244407
MEKQKLKHFKELLIKEKSGILNTLKLMNSNEPNDSMQEYFDELSSYDNHPADLGTEMFMMEQNMGLKSSQANIADKIDAALERINNGSYGVCEICGNSIDEDRLEILPYTNLCIECSDKELPIDKKMSYRPQEEENIQFPYGNSNTDISVEDNVGFDGEDSLQSVLKFNDVPGDPSFTTGDNQGIFDDVEHGLVEEVEGISEDYYKEQFIDTKRKDNSD